MTLHESLTPTMFLYSASNPNDKLPNYNIDVEENILAGLTAASFISYYQQIEQYRSTTKEPNHT